MVKIREKTIEISIRESKGTFSILKKKSSTKGSYDFSGMLALRQLLSNEKARILDVIKRENPKSIYELSKKLGRGFKSVNDDIKLLTRLGFIDLVKEKTKNRTRFRPKIILDSITIHLKI